MRKTSVVYAKRIQVLTLLFHNDFNYKLTADQTHVAVQHIKLWEREIGEKVFKKIKKTTLLEARR